MKKLKSNHESASPAAPLRESAAASARKLICQLEPDALRRPADGPEAGDAIAGADSPELAALKSRCAAFGIDASTAELILAGLLLLTQQTETALEVALLQSLRADRTVTRRRERR